MSCELDSKLVDKDCYECRVTGTLSSAAIGAFILYQSSAKYYTTRPYVRLAVQGLSVVFFYGSLARWFYLPPFHSLAPRRKSKEERSENV